MTKKESGKVRQIFNLKHLNDALTSRNFKMDKLDAAIRLMTPGCFMSSIDLLDAYYSVPIRTEHRNTSNLFGEEYCINLLLYPWVSKAACVFLQKFLSRFFAPLRSQYGYSCYEYIDDSIYIKDTADLICHATLTATRLFIRLVFRPHPTKSEFEPTQTLEF